MVLEGVIKHNKVWGQFSLKCFSLHFPIWQNMVSHDRCTTQNCLTSYKKAYQRRQRQPAPVNANHNFAPYIEGVTLLFAKSSFLLFCAGGNRSHYLESFNLQTFTTKDAPLFLHFCCPWNQNTFYLAKYCGNPGDLIQYLSRSEDQGFLPPFGAMTIL